MIYSDIAARYPELQNYKWIGGYSERDSVYLWRRENGKRIVQTIVGVPHYFCVRKQDYAKLGKAKFEQYKNRGIIISGKFDGDYLYIITDPDIYKSDLDKFFTELDNLGCKPLEGDVKRVQRLMIDLNLKVASLNDPQPPKIAFYDIETDDRSPKIIVGEEHILSCAWKEYDTGQEFFLCADSASDEGEYRFLVSLMEQLSEYDILVGYNNYAFDFEYLMKRFEYHGLDTRLFRQVEQLDIYNLFERQGTFAQYDSKNKRLDTIAKAVLGNGKLDHKEKIYDLWRENRSQLQEYNLEDVRLLFDMERKIKSVSLIVEMCAYAGLLHSLNYSPAKVVDSFILRKAQERRQSGVFDFRFPTQYYRPEHKVSGKYNPFARNALSGDKRRGRADFLKEEFDIDYQPVQGAYVKESAPGLYYNVHAFDFNSLYPNTIIAFNIGPDTLIDKNFSGSFNIAPNGARFRTDVVSTMSSAVEFLIEERKKIRGRLKHETDRIIREALDIQQRSTKELTNSFYGVTAQWGGRYYNREIAEAITASGRMFLPFGEQYLGALGYKVVIADTDSLYVEIPASHDPQKIMDQYLVELRRRLQEEYHCYRAEVLKMGYEKHMSRVLVLAKKLYAAWTIMEDSKEILGGKLTVKGLMMKKGNCPRWAREIAEQVLRDLLTQNYNAEHYSRLINQIKKQLECGQVDFSKLFLTARLGKAITEYINVRLCYVVVAKRLAERGQFVSSYQTINYIITDGNRPGVPLSALDITEVDENTEIDVAYYFNRMLMPQLESYLNVVYPERNWKQYRYPRNLKRNPFTFKVKLGDSSLALKSALISQEADDEAADFAADEEVELEVAGT
jgi:DNA polymerase elongation subunit (family B)